MHTSPDRGIGFGRRCIALALLLLMWMHHAGCRAMFDPNSSAKGSESQISVRSPQHAPMNCRNNNFVMAETCFANSFERGSQKLSQFLASRHIGKRSGTPRLPSADPKKDLSTQNSGYFRTPVASMPTRQSIRLRSGTDKRREPQASRSAASDQPCLGSWPPAAIHCPKTRSPSVGLYTSS